MEGRDLLPREESMNDDYAVESWTGSDNPGGEGGVSCDDGEEGQNQRRGYHRNNAEQIQELEAFFKEFPHPDDRQRLELSRRLGLGVRQIKFWFQNRRTQLKTQTERHDNIYLKEDNNRLKNENDVLKIRLTNPTCSRCNVPMFSNEAIELSFEELQLIRENARLKDELARLRALSEKVMGNSVNIPCSHSNHPCCNSDARNRCEGLKTKDRTVSTGLSLGNGTPMWPSVGTSEKRPHGKTGYMGAAISATNELMELAMARDPIWSPTFDRSTELLNHEEYLKMFSAGARLGLGLSSDGTRDTAILPLKSQDIVGILTDVDKWFEAFPCLIAKTPVIEVISAGPDGSKDGSLQLMKAEFQVLSPLVSTRQVRFLRFCKQHREGFWAVVDVSVEDDAGFEAPTNCRRLPSGCILQDLPDNYTKVTWVEHSEYDKSSIHSLFRHAMNSGMLFGAPRWVASLQRHCESRTSSAKFSGINRGGRQNILKLAQRMNELFCSGVSASTRSEWENIHVGNISEDVKIKYRRTISRPGAPLGLLLCVSTTFWMAATQEVLFDFLRDQHARDVLSLHGDMQEIVRVSKGSGHNNYVSLLRIAGMDSSQTETMVVQESWTDASGALIVYAPVDASVIAKAMNGIMDTDIEISTLLPSGFSIIPDGRGKPDGSLVTLGFQILVNTTHGTKLTPESFETLSNLISFTVNKMKAALGLS